MRKCTDSVITALISFTIIMLHSSLLRTAQVLINEVKCKPLSQDNFGMTSLHIAVENNHVTIVKLLAKAVECNSKNHIIGRTALHLAAAAGNTM